MKTFLRVHRIDLIAIAGIVLLVSGFFFDVLFFGRCFYLRDLSVYYYPAKSIVRDALLSGYFPFWNPFFTAGQPLAANPEYELFYPLQWLVLLPNYFLGFRLHILIHFYLAGVGMFLFLRSIALRPTSAFFGGLTYALSGPALSLTALLPVLFVYAWMPLVLLYSRRACLDGKRYDFAIAATAMGMQALIGEPTSLVQSWAAVIGLGAWYGWSGGRTRGAIRSAGRGLLLVATSAAVGAVQLIPAFDHAIDSVRSRGFDFDLVSRWSTPFSRLSEVVYPSVFRQLYQGTSALANQFYPSGEPFISELYLGLFLFLFVVAGFLTLQKNWLPALLLIAVSIVIAAGSHTPLLRLVYGLGLAKSIRYPEKALLTAIVVSVIFGSAVFDRFLQEDRRLRVTVVTLAIVWTAIALVGSLGGSSDLPAVPASYLHPGEIVMAPRTYWLLVAVRGLLAIAILAGFRKRWRAALAPVIIGFSAAEFVLLMPYVAPRMPREYFAKPASLGPLPPANGSFRIFHDADWDWAAGDPSAMAFFGQQPTIWWSFRNAAMPQMPARWGYEMALEDDFDETFLLPSADLKKAMWALKRSGRGDWKETLMTMSAAEFRSTFRPFDVESARVGGDLRRAVPVDWAKTSSHPRFYFAEQLVQITDLWDAASKLSTASWPSTVAFVTFSPVVPARGEVVRSEQRWNRASIDVIASGRSYLVISITPHKYWRATIDGRPATLHVTNLGFQGLEVPGGKHHVEMVYQNPLVMSCGALSMVALGSVFLMALGRRSLKGGRTAPR